MAINKYSKVLFKDIVALIYPDVCGACMRKLPHQKAFLCFDCEYNLPYTNYHKSINNPLAKYLWGRMPIETAAAFYKFSKGGRIQHLLHQFKYKKQLSLGKYLGICYAEQLKTSKHLRSCDLVVPIPLHPKKEKLRGFNQSAVFAEGIAIGLHKTLMLHNLVKTIHNATQTKKSRIERWENVKHVYKVLQPQALAHKHILLVDDVVTTGATFEAAVRTLKEISGLRISIVTLAAPLEF